MKKVFVLLIIMVLILSCQKEDDSLSSWSGLEIRSQKFMPLEVGNYWIHEIYSIDSEGNERKWNSIDSVIITKDTIIDNERFFVLEGIRWPNRSDWGIVSILRDSAGRIIDPEGRIEMSEFDFNDTISTEYMIGNDDTICCIYRVMVEGLDSITVPAGRFKVLNCEGDLYNYRFDPPRKHNLTVNKYYSNGVGIVLKKMIYTNPDEEDYVEKRLMRYHVNE